MRALALSLLLGTTLLTGCLNPQEALFQCQAAADCPSGWDCQNGVCVNPACVSETKDQFCARLALQCGSFTGPDNCGRSQTFECGSCASEQSCVMNHCQGPMTDAGHADGGVDAGTQDAGSEDAGNDDAGPQDAGQEDAGTDAGPLDAGTDAGTTDAGSDAGPHDAGTDAGTDAGMPDAGPVPQSLQIQPGPTYALDFGTTAQLTLVETFSDGSTTTLPDNAPNVTWSSQDPLIASVSETGFLRGEAVGMTSISASHDGLTANLSVTVRPPPPNELVIYSGDNQDGFVGTALALPLTVWVVRGDGSATPVPGETITFVPPVGGAVSATTVQTNAQGQASVIATLGPTPGDQTFTARDGDVSVTFTAHVACQPDQLRCQNVCTSVNNQNCGSCGTACGSGYECDPTVPQCKLKVYTCSSNAECPAQAPTCDLGTGHCVQCLRTSECSGDRICDQGSCNTCSNPTAPPLLGNCNPDDMNICSLFGGAVCDAAGKCCMTTAPATCHSDSDCGSTQGTPFCDPHGACVACTRNSQCGSGNVCLRNACVADTTGGACLADADCSGLATPVCGPLNTCVQCSTDAQCPTGGTCVQNTCHLPVGGHCAQGNDTQSNCNAGLRCHAFGVQDGIDNMCTRDCRSDAECGSNAVGSNVCAGLCLPACHQDGDCHYPNEICLRMTESSSACLPDCRNQPASFCNAVYGYPSLHCSQEFGACLIAGGDCSLGCTSGQTCGELQVPGGTARACVDDCTAPTAACHSNTDCITGACENGTCRGCPADLVCDPAQRFCKPCASGRSVCGNSCLDLQTDASNCGTCGHACGPGGSCSGGVCQCGSGYSLCDGNTCSDPSQDVNNCGSCGQRCLGPGSVCQGGHCGCQAGFDACGPSTCADTRNDPANCGSCGNACSPNQACANGTCSCPDGTAACNGSCPDYQNDPANCGSCGHSCTGSDICLTGRCARPCTSDANCADAAGHFCSGNHCVECVRDADCGSASSVCEAGTCLNVASNLEGALWQLPCTASLGPNTCVTADMSPQELAIGGTPGASYDVTLHFRGVVEQKTYPGGCSPDGTMWIVDASGEGDASFNVFGLDTSGHHYYLNAGASGVQHTFALDYQQTVRVQGGSTLTLFGRSGDGTQISNVDAGGAPITVAGTSLPQPYDGQFVQMNVVSVAPASGALPACVCDRNADCPSGFCTSQHVCASAPVAYYRGSGVDLSGHGNDAVLHGNVALAPDRFGTDAMAASFDGSTSTYMEVASSNLPVGAAPRSAVVWMKTSTDFNAAHQAGSLFNYGTGADHQRFGLLVAAPNNDYFVSEAGDLGGTVPLNDGTWHQVAVTYDGTTITLYVDGLVDLSSPIAMSTVGQSLEIGRSVQSRPDFELYTGLIDELRFYNRALSAEEIAALYHEGGWTGCAAGQTRCVRSCVNTSSDAANCGGCGVACEANQVCQSAACLQSCTTDSECTGTLTCMNGACRQRTNCKAFLDCLATCGSDTPCQNRCWAATTPQGQADYGTLATCIINVCPEAGSGSCDTNCQQCQNTALMGPCSAAWGACQND